MKLATLETLNAARRARQPVAVVTDLVSGTVRVVPESTASMDPLGDEIGARFRSGASGIVAAGNGDSVFVAIHLPPPRLVVIGAVHISQALAPIAMSAGFEVTIIDPRTAFASTARFGEVKPIAAWPEQVLPEVGLDPSTALAALSHDPRIDDGAILAALTAPCFYVGALGSRRTHRQRLERLRQQGVDEAQLASIRAPIGLPIGAQTPAEIAVAIVAEIIAAWRTRVAHGAEATT